MEPRSKTAVLVIDVQNDVVAAAYRRDEVVANIGVVIERARAANVPVVWIQHDDDGLAVGTEGWQIVPELEPQANEPVINKNFRSSFDATTLEATLDELDVGRLIITGSQTDFCVRWTLHGALDRGYDTVLVADAHTTDAVSPADMPQGAELIAHTNSTWGSQATKRAETAVVPTADLVF